jgi:hypothetical protein
LSGNAFSTNISTDNGNSTLNGGTRVVFFAAAGTGAVLPPNISPGVAYYSCYLDGQTFAVYSTITAASNAAITLTDGGALPTTGLIDPTGGSGEIVVLYSAVTSIENCSHFTLTDFTMDNAFAQVTQTIGTTGCGGYGLLYADYLGFLNTKGSISITGGTRIELNTPPACDPRTNAQVPNIIRIIGSNITTGLWPAPCIGIHLADLAFTLNNGTQRNICALGTTFGELAYNLENITGDVIASFVENDCYNMVGSIQAGAGRVTQASSPGLFGINALTRQINEGVMKWGGLQLATANDTVNSILAPGDYMLNPGIVGPALYKSVNPVPGYTYGSSTGTNTGMSATTTVGSALVTLGAAVTAANWGPHTAVSIAGALDGINPLVGVVGPINNLVNPATFILINPATGMPLPAGAAVSAAVMSYVPPVIAQVDAVQVYTLSATFTAAPTSAITEVDVTVAGAAFPTSSTAPTPVWFGWPTSLATGIAASGFIKSATTIGVRLTNLSGAAYTGTINFTARVPQ